MARLSSMLINKNPLAQMQSMSNNGLMPGLGDNSSIPHMVYNPTQRIDNQMKTSKQVINYASSKAMAEQGRTDMRGNVSGYSDTLA